MRWAFWRSPAADPGPEPVRALPDGVGLPTRPGPPAASVPADDADDDRPAPDGAVPRNSRATPTADGPDPTYEPPLSAPGPGLDLDRSAVRAAGPDVARLVAAARAGAPVQAGGSDARALAAAATGALAARLPALSGVDGAVAFDEPEDELLHAYADLLVTRAAVRRTASPVERDDLLAVAHLAAAAAAVDAAAETALLLLAGVPADVQLGAAALLLAQTAEDGGGTPERVAVEVRELFAGQG